ALAYVVQAAILDNANDPGGPAAAQRAADILQPLAEVSHASVVARRAYVETLVRIGFEQVNSNQNEEAVRSENEAMRIASDLGAQNLKSLDMAAYYADAGGWLVQALASLSRNDEARRAGADASAKAEQVLEQRPGYRMALHAQQVIVGVLATVEQNDLNPLAALAIDLRQEQVSLTLLKLDPGNMVSINNLAVARGQIGDTLWQAGRLHEAMPHYLQQLDDAGRAAAGGTGFLITRAFVMLSVAYRQAQLGDPSAAQATLAAGAPFLARLRRSEPPGSLALVIVDTSGKLASAAMAYDRDDFAGVRRIVAGATDELQDTTAHGGLQRFQKFLGLYIGYFTEGRAEYLLGDFAGAERSLHAALAARKVMGGEDIGTQRDLGELNTWIVMAQARQGHLNEGAQTIAPVVRMQRQLAARNHGDRWLPQELAAALYAEALAAPGKRAALLHEAAGLIAGLAPEVAASHDERLWRALILKAQ
ncbi:MAG: hypothetical protein ACRETS_12885, partial [Steroidobacteraceae bacterium]